MSGERAELQVVVEKYLIPALVVKPFSENQANLVPHHFRRHDGLLLGGTCQTHQALYFFTPPPAATPALYVQSVSSTDTCPQHLYQQSGHKHLWWRQRSDTFLFRVKQAPAAQIKPERGKTRTYRTWGQLRFLQWTTNNPPVRTEIKVSHGAFFKFFHREEESCGHCSGPRCLWKSHLCCAHTDTVCFIPVWQVRSAQLPAARPDSSAGRDQRGGTCTHQNLYLSTPPPCPWTHSKLSPNTPAAMSGFLSNALGGGGGDIARLAGQKAGENNMIKVTDKMFSDLFLFLLQVP